MYVLSNHEIVKAEVNAATWATGLPVLFNGTHLCLRAVAHEPPLEQALVTPRIKSQS